MPPHTIDTKAIARPLLTAVLLALTVPPASAQLGGQRQLGSPAPAARAEDATSALYDALREEPRETPVSRVAQAVKPSVVYVETEHVQAVRTIFGVQRQIARGSGSGVVIHPTGFIVTNYHVVEGARHIRVSFDGDPQPYAARLMSFVREEDLALLKIEQPLEPRSSAQPGDTTGSGLRSATRSTFPTVRMGTSSDLMPGERVIAIGSPHGQTHTVSSGIISGLHRNVPVPQRRLNFRGLIQTDASINRGNSGGPLLNIHGELIGINTVMNTDAENIGFAIPVDRVRQVLTDILFPKANRIWLGFDVTQRAADLVVTKVWENGPAAEQGICEGDVIVSVQGTPVSDSESYLLQKLQVDPGQMVVVGVQRGGDTTDHRITSWDELNGSFFEDIGMTVTEARLDWGRSLMVDRVRPGSPASELGIVHGDVIPAIRPKTFRRSTPIRLGDKATLRLVLDRVPVGTEIEIDAYRDLNSDARFQRNELLKGVLIR